MNEITFDGTLKVGHNVQIGYFAQNQAQLLDGDITVFDTIDSVAKGDMRTKVRDILGAFMFPGENVDKFVKVLSGGERSRLAMIRLLLEPVNLLILDEPTNHLDMQSKEVLKNAIKEFDGTVIVVSHDRDFLDGLVSRVYEFADGKVREFLGGIYEFLEKKRLENEGLTGVGKTIEPQSVDNKSQRANLLESVNTKSASAMSYEQQKELAKLKRKAEKRLEDAEDKVEMLEKQIAEVEETMATPEGATNMKLFTKHAQLKKLLEQAENEWETVADELESIK
jgi:ATP-binding cassette subfamily F protein 3